METLKIYTLATAPWFLIAHLVAALAASVLGAIVLFKRKGTPRHMLMGRAWVGLMVFVAISSFWIQARGHLSWIHGLSIWILFCMPMGILSIRRGNVVLHRVWMAGSYAGLMIAGVFTLLPHRMLGLLVWS